jgi:hypothetical protein
MTAYIVRRAIWKWPFCGLLALLPSIDCDSSLKKIEINYIYYGIDIIDTKDG